MLIFMVVLLFGVNNISYLTEHKKTDAYPITFSSKKEEGKVFQTAQEAQAALDRVKCNVLFAPLANSNLKVIQTTPPVVTPPSAAAAAATSATATAATETAETADLDALFENLDTRNDTL